MSAMDYKKAIDMLEVCLSNPDTVDRMALDPDSARRVAEIAVTMLNIAGLSIDEHIAMACRAAQVGEYYPFS